jgi:hypothetical protein
MERHVSSHGITGARFEVAQNPEGLEHASVIITSGLTARNVDRSMVKAIVSGPVCMQINVMSGPPRSEHFPKLAALIFEAFPYPAQGPLGTWPVLEFQEATNVP